ncbi:hypothetical protein K5K93_11565 [Stenotrophomonas sp. DR822]|uniref:hypothetical protein n=1 Tax=unclassified Stenotrophomonas TaxID=196198 RepID=UPI001C97FA5A|nr:hypothetical protein [Stenotrophomonas sp. DR822]QZN79264.1 hypothetical protein K5K93_11565 [Stenotrophomonas sp. DR822]
MQNCTRVSLLALVLAYSASASAAAQTGDGVRESLREQMLVAQKNAQISSAARLDSYLAAIPVDSPLTLLSADGLEQFLTSLSFNENGLVGYSTDAIASELSYSQARRLLSLFGAERTLRLMPGLRVDTEVDRDIRRSYVQSGELVEDHMGYRCVARATCRESTEFVCMSGC